MSKLFNLKEWLTVADTARYLSIKFGEDATEADVLRLALDGRLKLSVYFVNRAKARSGKVVRYSEVDLRAAIISGNLPDDLSWATIPAEAQTVGTLGPHSILDDAKGERIVFIFSLQIDEDRYLTLSDEVTTIEGVWDLPMIGNEQLDIEHEYHNLTGGPAVTLQSLEGAFVEGRDGEMCQLQESFDDNEYQAGSRAQLDRIKQHIADGSIETGEAERQLQRHKEQRKEFLEKKESLYYPAGGLPRDGVIVVRTEALREFEACGNDAPMPTSRAHVSDKLAKMNQAAEKFWSNADREDRTTHPDNATVAAWLVQNDFSATLADKAATIIRPEWARTGRKPRE